MLSNHEASPLLDIFHIQIFSLKFLDRRRRKLRSRTSGEVFSGAETFSSEIQSYGSGFCRTLQGKFQGKIPIKSTRCKGAWRGARIIGVMAGMSKEQMSILEEA